MQLASVLVTSTWIAFALYFIAESRQHHLLIMSTLLSMTLSASEPIRQVIFYLVDVCLVLLINKLGLVLVQLVIEN